jgi:hypothetical protein
MAPRSGTSGLSVLPRIVDDATIAAAAGCENPRAPGDGRGEEERARPDVAPTLAFGRHAPLNDHGYRSLGGSRACPASASLRVHTSSGGTIRLILMIDEADPRPLDLRDSRPISRPPYHSDRIESNQLLAAHPSSSGATPGTLDGKDLHFRSPVPVRPTEVSDRRTGHSLHLLRVRPTPLST